MRIRELIWTEERLLAQDQETRHRIIAYASPAERFIGLTPEEMVTLMKEIEAQLQEQPSQPQGAKRKSSRRPTK
jgi:hypothetical protein